MSLEDGLREIAVELGGRLGEAFVEKAQGHAPRRTGELAESIEDSGPEDNGASVTVTCTCGAEHGI
jgi:hypothetical protein